MGAGDARAALDEMALRRNDSALGAFCARYCGVVAQHPGIEDDAVFPHLARSEPALAPVIDRLTDALPSHLSYEERRPVEPLARHGFQPGQV